LGLAHFAREAKIGPDDLERLKKFLAETTAEKEP
jgi:hypothetical protein